MASTPLLPLLLAMLFVMAIFVDRPCSAADVASVITSDMFERFLYNRDGADSCESQGFYTYGAFLEAARFGKWNGVFGSKKHELAAFFAQVAHETTYGCYVREKVNRRDPSVGNYYGRGPLQLTHDYNYGPAGDYIGEDLIRYPDRIASNPVVSFKTAIWFWMTQPTAGNCPHSCMVAQMPADFGCTIRAINSQECGSTVGVETRDRIRIYKDFCNQLGIGYPPGRLSCS